MYPSLNVKINKQNDQFSLRNNGGSSLTLRNMDSLSIRAEDDQSHSAPSLARITKACVPNFRGQLISASKGTVKNSGLIQHNTKMNVRANSAPRPRAVLSSPDNDRMMGSRVKLMEEKPSHSSTKEKTPSQNKAIHDRVQVARPMKTKKGSEEALDNKKGVEQSKFHEPVIQKRGLLRE